MIYDLFQVLLSFVKWFHKHWVLKSIFFYHETKTQLFVSIKLVNVIDLIIKRSQPKNVKHSKTFNFVNQMHRRFSILCSIETLGTQVTMCLKSSKINIGRVFLTNIPKHRKSLLRCSRFEFVLERISIACLRLFDLFWSLC